MIANKNRKLATCIDKAADAEYLKAFEYSLIDFLQSFINSYLQMMKD